MSPQCRPQNKPSDRDPGVRFVAPKARAALTPQHVEREHQLRQIMIHLHTIAESMRAIRDLMNDLALQVSKLRTIHRADRRDLIDAIVFDWTPYSASIIQSHVAIERFVQELELRAGDPLNLVYLANVGETLSVDTHPPHDLVDSEQENPHQAMRSSSEALYLARSG